MRVARKKVEHAIVDLIAQDIVLKLPAALMRRFVRGDCGKPMLEAMKLTAPYFV